MTTCPNCRSPMFGAYCVCGYKMDIPSAFEQIFGTDIAKGIADAFGMDAYNDDDVDADGQPTKG